MTTTVPAIPSRQILPQLLMGAIWIYCSVYAFEGVIRYFLNMFGADSLIFVRDILLLLPTIFLFFVQFIRKAVHPAYWVYLAIILLHGLVFYLNFKLLSPIVFGIKIFLPMLAGAVMSRAIMQPSRKILLLVLLLWVSSAIGVWLDKYAVSFPWVGMTTTIGDVEVEISKDWQVSGDEYRAGGFSRSSLYISNLFPLLALILILNLRKRWACIAVALLSLPVIYWTTQKGALLAYLVVIGGIAVWPRKPIVTLRPLMILFTLAVILLPITLPSFSLSQGNVGGFSNNSFILRVEMMWPEAWQWIKAHEIFPFGVGLGGISSAQQIYARSEMNAADNLFIFMYAYFGLMAVVYLALTCWLCVRLPNAMPRKEDTLAVSILLFIIAYGCVLSMLEGQMAALFAGAALGWLAYDRRHALRDAHAVTGLNGTIKQPSAALSAAHRDHATASTMAAPVDRAERFLPIQ